MRANDRVTPTTTGQCSHFAASGADPASAITLYAAMSGCADARRMVAGHDLLVAGPGQCDGTARRGLRQVHGRPHVVRGAPAHPGHADRPGETHLRGMLAPQDELVVPLIHHALTCRNILLVRA
jgi:hypothetical protein